MDETSEADSTVIVCYKTLHLGILKIASSYFHEDEKCCC